MIRPWEREVVRFTQTLGLREEALPGLVCSDSSTVFRCFAFLSEARRRLSKSICSGRREVKNVPPLQPSRERRGGEPGRFVYRIGGKRLCADYERSTPDNDHVNVAEQGMDSVRRWEIPHSLTVQLKQESVCEESRGNLAHTSTVINSSLS